MATTKANAILSRIPTDRTMIGVEIGVYRGENAEVLLNKRPNLVLLCVDPWTRFMYNHTDQDHITLTEDWDKVYGDACKRLMPTGRALICRALSVRAASVFVDERNFDFVWIDGWHESPWIDQDILVWQRTIKPGGWIGGHDHNDQYPDVKTAVAKAADEYGWAVELGGDDTWFARIE